MMGMVEMRVVTDVSAPGAKLRAGRLWPEPGSGGVGLGWLWQVCGL